MCWHEPYDSIVNWKMFICLLRGHDREYGVPSRHPYRNYRVTWACRRCWKEDED